MSDSRLELFRLMRHSATSHGAPAASCADAIDAPAPDWSRVRLQSHRERLRQSQGAAAQAGERSVNVLIAYDAFSRQECVLVAAAGYDPDLKR